MLIGYYKCSIKSGRNADFPIHVLYAYDKDWGENVLRQRGLLGNRILSRLAHQHEIDSREKSWRATSYKYKNVEELASDEELAGTSREFIALIKKSFERIT